MDGLKRVVIVGKPNVGKSQLFNRLAGEKHSIVVDEPGVTRDRVELKVDWYGSKFLLVDTGGYADGEVGFQREINEQTEIALGHSDVILFVVSWKEGITVEDIYLSNVLKKKRAENVIVVANKCDCGDDGYLGEMRLGFGEAISISAEHGINTGILLDAISKRVGKEIWSAEEPWKIAIIGKPNVGKSSLVNSLLGQDRVIVSDRAGTTRDAIDVDFEFGREEYRIIDTPGIRRHSSIKDDEKEKYSILRAQKAIGRANMVWLMVDVEEGICELDERIGGLVFKANIPLVILANKSDTIREEDRRGFLKEIAKRFKYLHWAPVVFISAKESRNLDSIFRKTREIRGELSRRVDPRIMKEFVSRVSLLYTVPNVKGRKLNIISMSQVDGQVPTFLFLCNDPELLHFSYSRLVERQIRSVFNFRICPITAIYKKK